jgi:hypothetical protein
MLFPEWSIRKKRNNPDRVLREEFPEYPGWEVCARKAVHPLMIAARAGASKSLMSRNFLFTAPGADTWQAACL